MIYVFMICNFMGCRGMRLQKLEGEAPPFEGRREEVADYVASMSDDLSRLSRRSGLTVLAYLLDMARLEAESAARTGGGEADPAARSKPGL